jgi:hypothetical protein
MRLVRAEVLKLVRRRGLMAWSLLLTIGVVAVVETILVILHAANASHHGPAGGPSNFRGAADTLALLGTLTAVLIGATAGSQDVANGVFRDLVVTGRKRSTLFNVRIPGAFLVWAPMVLVGFAVAITASFVFTGDLPNPSSSDVGHELAYIFALGVVNLFLAVGLAAIVSSRIVIGVLIVWSSAISHILIAFHSLGGARKYIDVAAAEHFQPHTSSDQQVAMSSATAIVILAAWAAVFAFAGRFWTNRRDA